MKLTVTLKKIVTCFNIMYIGNEHDILTLKKWEEWLFLNILNDTMFIQISIDMFYVDTTLNTSLVNRV